MTRPPFALLLAGLLAAAGCTSAPPPTRSVAAARAACRARSEAAFNRQNRALLSTRDTTDTPFSTSGDTGITTRGLSREYERVSQLDACLGASQAPPDSGIAGDGTAFQGASTRTPGLPGQ